jgi:ATP-dependent DNA ligase
MRWPTPSPPGSDESATPRRVGPVELPVMPPVSPMLAKLTRELPVGDFLYEPKWDGFRCIVFRDGDEVELGSRNERPLTRYFPEVIDAIRESLPPRCVVDGEVVVAGPGGLDFDALQQRIHPAVSRVRLLATKTPASLVAFDLLALGADDLRTVGFGERRAALVSALAGAAPPVHLTPATTDRDVAAGWFSRFEGAGLDGVVAKGVGLRYLEDQRVMLKVKHERTADFVVAGFRTHKSGQGVGSLMLGLYGDSGGLHHVGVIGAFSVARRTELLAEIEPYRELGSEPHPWSDWARWADAGAGAAASGQRLPGAISRWNANKDLSFEPLRPDLVVEAAYEHLQGDRLRHTAQWRRWRPDRDPRSCTYDQLETVVPALLADVFGA